MFLGWGSSKLKKEFIIPLGERDRVAVVVANIHRGRDCGC
jgi:hypothetical protein